MPGGDGLGPPKGQAGRGGRKGGTRSGAGPGGNCICLSCGQQLPHKQGTPCYNVNCPKCGARMVRG